MKRLFDQSGRPSCDFGGAFPRHFEPCKQHNTTAEAGSLQDGWPAIWRVFVQRQVACHLANRTDINQITNNSVLLYLMLVFKHILLAYSIDL